MTDMESNGVIVTALAEHIEARMLVLRIDGPTALARLAGVSVEGLRPLLRGVRKDYQARLTRPVCDALGWSHDSIAMLLEGGEPCVVGARPLVGLDLDQLAELIADKHADLVRRMEAMTTVALRVLEGMNRVVEDDELDAAPTDSRTSRPRS